jgi:hypothetical protein
VAPATIIRTGEGFALALKGYSSGAPYTFGFSNSAVWMYSLLLSGFTFIPGRNCRSYYGCTFVPLFASTPHTVTRSTSRSHIQSSRTGHSTTTSATPSRPAPRPHPTVRGGGRHGHSGEATHAVVADSSSMVNLFLCEFEIAFCCSVIPRPRHGPIREFSSDDVVNRRPSSRVRRIGFHMYSAC